jgi:hypothetical protein
LEEVWQELLHQVSCECYCVTCDWQVCVNSSRQASCSESRALCFELCVFKLDFYRAKYCVQQSWCLRLIVSTVTLTNCEQHDWLIVSNVTKCEQHDWLIVSNVTVTNCEHCDWLTVSNVTD